MLEKLKTLCFTTMSVGENGSLRRDNSHDGDVEEGRDAKDCKQPKWRSYLRPTITVTCVICFLVLIVTGGVYLVTTLNTLQTEMDSLKHNMEDQGVSYIINIIELINIII